MKMAGWKRRKGGRTESRTGLGVQPPGRHMPATDRFTKGEVKMSMRKASRRLWTAIPLVVFFMLAVPSAAFAGREVTGAAVDGQARVTVQPGATLRVDVRVVTTGGGTANDWGSTRWTIGPSTDCADHTDAGASSDTYTANFDVTVPASAGTYDATFVAFQNDDCTGAPATDVSLTLSNAVIVDDTILFDDHFRGTTEANNLENTTPPWTDDSDNDGQQVMRRIDTTAPGTPQDGFSDGYLGLRGQDYAVKQLSTAGKSNIQLRYTWGEDTSSPPHFLRPSLRAVEGELQWFPVHRGQHSLPQRTSRGPGDAGELLLPVLREQHVHRHHVQGRHVVRV